MTAVGALLPEGPRRRLAKLRCQLDPLAQAGSHPTPTAAAEVDDVQRRFDTFGFVVCRDIFDSAAVERLSRSYDAQFPALEPGEGEGGAADPADRGLARRFPPSLADGNPFRADFLENAAVLDVVENLLGPGFLFLTAACVRFAGETPWHWCAPPDPRRRQHQTLARQPHGHHHGLSRA